MHKSNGYMLLSFFFAQKKAGVWPLLRAAWLPFVENKRAQMLKVGIAEKIITTSNMLLVVHSHAHS